MKKRLLAAGKAFVPLLCLWLLVGCGSSASPISERQKQKFSAAGGIAFGEYSPTPAPSGEQLEQLTSSEKLGWDGTVASVSPTGRYAVVRVPQGIVVYEQREGEWFAGAQVDLSSLDAHSGEGSVEKVMVMLNAEGFDVAWAPDESSFAFCIPRATKYMVDSHIYLCETQDGAVRCLSDNVLGYSASGLYTDLVIDAFPAYSSDGTYIYFSRYSAQVGLMRVMVQGDALPETVVDLDRTDYVSSVYEIDGTVYYANTPPNIEKTRGIYTVQPGEEPVLLFENTTGELYNYYIKGISATGQLVVLAEQYVQKYGEYALTLFLLDIESGTSNKPLDIYMHPNSVEHNEMLLSNVAISPDGCRLLIAETNRAKSLSTLRVIDLNSNESIIVYRTDEPHFCVLVGPANRYSTLHWLANDHLVMYYDGQLHLSRLAAELSIR